MPDTRVPRILIVEDSDEWNDVLTNYFSDQYGLCSAKMLSEALDLIDRYFFDVAIVDLRLDENDPNNWQGLEVLKRLWQLKEGTQCIVLTGKATPDTVRIAWQEYNAFDSVEKQKQGSDTQYMKDIVTKAAEKARRHMLNRIETDIHVTNLIPTTICERADLMQILHTATLDNLQWLLERTFRGLYPVKLDKSTFESNRTEGWLQAVYWSKMLGVPLLITIGSAQVVMQHRVDGVLQGGVQRSITRKYLEEIESRIACVAYQLEDANLEYFIDLPVKASPADLLAE